MNLAELRGRCEEVVDLPGGGFMFRCPLHGEVVASAGLEDGRLVVSCEKGCPPEVLLAGLNGTNGNGRKRPPKVDATSRGHPGADILRRTPPQDIEAEECVIGCVFLDGESLPKIRQILKATDFYREKHRTTFAAICSLAARNIAVDVITVSAALRTTDELAEVGPEFIAEMAVKVPTASNAEHYATIVRDMSIKRNVISATTMLATLAYDGVTVDGLMGEAERLMAPLLSGQALTLYEDRQAIDAYDAHQIMVSDHRGYSLGGLIKEGCTMIVSGLMGAGKSTFAMNLARAWFLGEPFLGRPARQSRTLVVVSPKEYEAWAETIGFWKIQGGVFLVESTKGHFAKTHQQVAWFEQEMDRLGCQTFVLDTLFDFYGMPANTAGDENRKVMNEQAPFLQMVRERMFSGLVLGHPPKSEAYALTPRDPEEAFGGHTAWTAQHRMRGSIRRNAGANAFITGRGGYGDEGIRKEEMLLFDEQSRIVSLGGPFSDYLGVVAMPTVVDALDGWMSRSDVEKKTGKRKEWILAGLKEGLKQGTVKHNGKAKNGRKYARFEEPEQDELFG